MEFRLDATERGLDWAAVEAAVHELRARDREKRSHEEAVRRTAWLVATGGRQERLATFGFRLRWGKKAALRDHTVIPGYDEIAQEVASAHPEYSGPDGTERLFALLLAPMTPPKPWKALYAEAIELVAREAVGPMPAEGEALVPF